MASSAGLRRKQTKGTSQAEIHPVTNHLVVCSATTEDDAWLFGDFLGFTSALKEQAVHGTFINCFNLDSYFTNTAHDDVKFGRRREILEDEIWDSGDQISIYTRDDFEHRTRWWEQLSQSEVQDVIPRVLDWIAGRSQTTKPGDVVSIVLIGNSSLAGMVMGKSVLEPETLASACSRLPPDVQLNLSVKGYESRLFSRAFQTSGRRRNSAFSSTFVRTLGLIREPDIWTLEKHGTSVKAQLAKPPRDYQPTPQIPDSKKLTMMRKILCQDYVDISFSNAQHVRRIINPPSIPSLFPQNPTRIPPNMLQCANSSAKK